METRKSSNSAEKLRSTINAIISETIDGGSPQLFDYDAAGRLTDDGTLTYAWDRADRLLKTEDGVTTINYEYNGLGHRVKQDTTDYLLDTVQGLPRVIADKTGSTVNRYVFSDHGLLRHQQPDSSWVHPLRDGLGSVRHIVDASLGPVYSVNHTPYGEPWNAQGTSPMPFGFTGEWQDPNDLLFLRARYYNPAQAAFLSLDPLEGGLGNVRALNRYGYVQANPVNLVDPSGFIFEDPNVYGGCGGPSSPERRQAVDCATKITDIRSSWGTSLTYDFPNDENTSWCSFRNKNTGIIYDFTEYLERGFTAVSRKFNVRTVFAGLEFRLFNQHGPRNQNAAAIQGPSRVNWYGDSMALELRLYGDGSREEDLSKTFVHELGHVLENRTAVAGGQYDSVSLGRDFNPLSIWSAAKGSGSTEILPAKDLISDMEEKNPSDSLEEKIADTFMFWVYNRFEPTVEAEVARIILEGGVVLWNRESQEYPYLANLQNANLSEFLDTYIAEASTLQSSDVQSLLVFTVSPGMDYWTA